MEKITDSCLSKFSEQRFFWPVSHLMPDRQFPKTDVSVDVNVVPV